MHRRADAELAELLGAQVAGEVQALPDRLLDLGGALARQRAGEEQHALAVVLGHRDRPVAALDERREVGMAQPVAQRQFGVEDERIVGAGHAPHDDVERVQELCDVLDRARAGGRLAVPDLAEQLPRDAVEQARRLRVGHDIVEGLFNVLAVFAAAGKMSLFLCPLVFVSGRSWKTVIAAPSLPNWNRPTLTLHFGKSVQAQRTTPAP